jgi:hypothetical protein
VCLFSPHRASRWLLALKSILDDNALVEEIDHHILAKLDLKLFGPCSEKLGIVDEHDLLAAGTKTVDHPLTQMGRKRELDTLPQGHPIKALMGTPTSISMEVRVFLHECRRFDTNSAMPDRLDLDQTPTLESEHITICITEDPELIIRDRNLGVTDEIPPHLTPGAFVRTDGLPEQLTVKASPHTPKNPHLPSPGLPLLMRVMAAFVHHF